MAKIPSIGRTVHVVRHDATGLKLQHFPGKVVVAGEADGVIPNIRLFTTITSWNMLDVPHDPTGATVDSWHWPEYVPEDA